MLHKEYLKYVAYSNNKRPHILFKHYTPRNPKDEGATKKVCILAYLVRVFFPVAFILIGYSRFSSPTGDFCCPNYLAKKRPSFEILNRSPGSLRSLSWVREAGILAYLVRVFFPVAFSLVGYSRFSSPTGHPKTLITISRFLGRTPSELSGKNAFKFWKPYLALDARARHSGNPWQKRKKKRRFQCKLLQRGIGPCLYT